MLTWTEHISQICCKTRKLIGLFYRRFQHCEASLLIILYKSFIRPHLEYVPHVWDPYLVKEKQLLEKTQRFALRVCCKDLSVSYNDLLERCHVQALTIRRKTIKLSHLYKNLIVLGLTDCQIAPVTVKSVNYNTRRSNSMQLEHISAQSSQF